MSKLAQAIEERGTTAAPAVMVKTSFNVGDRIKIQRETIRKRDYTIIGRLTSLLFEAQRDLSGFSQSRPRYHNAEQAKLTSEALKPFSEKQTVLWASTTLDWLSHKNAPILAISRDRQDLLLPAGLTPLPPIPDPRWTPQTADDIAPRIPQLLTGCPVVGDRVRDKIKARDGRVLGVIHPVIELCIMLASVQGGFGRIRGGVDPADGTHLALLIDDSDGPEQLQAYFVGGRFQLGGG